MHIHIVPLLADPKTGDPLELVVEKQIGDSVITGDLLNPKTKQRYPITQGIPRFVTPQDKSSVVSFGLEWNYFNFTDFKEHWLQHTVKNTFGSTTIFKDKLIIDAGGGSGAQTLWMLESGARHVILLDLSDSVDDVVQRNLLPSGFTNYDVIQCSIDAPPLRRESINGMIICHNVIQHTPSVERTAQALYSVLAPGGEFVFNCYPRNDQGVLRYIRFHVSEGLRYIFKHCSFKVILSYSYIAATLRVIPGVGGLLEKMGLYVCGDVPRDQGESFLRYSIKRFKATALNTYDSFGFHKYQHYKSNAEIQALVNELQPDATKILNTADYFKRPIPVGCALRIFK